MSDSVELDVAGRQVTISHPNKVFFPTRQETKLDLVRYYLSVGDAVMRQMHHRPVMMQRFPDGAGGKSFYQKRVPAGAPEWLQTTVVRTMNGTESRVLVIADLAHLAWAVNLGCVGFHSWPFRAASPADCDELRLDLDPSPGTNFPMVQEAAAVLHELLQQYSVTSFVKTSGSRGIHVYVRLANGHDSINVRRVAVAIARELERRRPDLITASWWKEERGQRIFLDFNQNAPHRTMFSPWSVRAYDHAPVSCPIPWSLLGLVHPQEMTISTVPAWLAEHGDPWAAIDEKPQSLEALMALVQLDDAANLPDAPWPPDFPKAPGEPPRVAPTRRRRDASGD